MEQALDLLEKRVNAVADLVKRLRGEVARLERELAEQPRPETVARSLSTPVPDGRLAEEITRLRAERSLVRERIRVLIKEIDQVSW
jgi:hypothetical protein